MVFFSSIKRFEVIIQRFFVNLFYSIPDSNLQFIKGKLAGIFVDILRATQYNKRQEINTYRASLIYLCHAYLKHVDWYICQSLILWSFCCFPGNTAGLTQANRYQTSVPQPCNEPAWVYWWTRFFGTNFLYQKKEAQLTERKFKKYEIYICKNIKSQACPMEKLKTENYILSFSMFYG